MRAMQRTGKVICLISRRSRVWRERGRREEGSRNMEGRFFVSSIINGHQNECVLASRSILPGLCLKKFHSVCRKNVSLIYLIIISYWSS